MSERDGPARTVRESIQRQADREIKTARDLGQKPPPREQLVREITRDVVNHERKQERK